MKLTYEVIEIEGRNSIIQATDEHGFVKFIPMSEDNWDFQQYLNKDKPKVIAE